MDTIFGSYSEDGLEYIISNPNTPMPWVNVISNGDYGLVISQAGSGYSWRRHASLNRINRWEQDLIRDRWGKYLYLRDQDRVRGFYETVLGLVPMMRDERLTAFAVGPGSVLLLFRQGTTQAPARTPGGTIPPHDGSGRLHFAFAIGADTLEAWRSHLAQHQVAIESEVSWPRGGRSIYFRDPEENLVELATPGLWENY